MKSRFEWMDRGRTISMRFTCLGVTDAVPFRIESDLFEADFGGLALVRLGFHFIGGQNHVTDGRNDFPCSDNFVFKLEGGSGGFGWMVILDI